jgi:predicted Kef-type K+ transport protein
MEEVFTDGVWLSVAFLSGLIAKRMNLPSLIGFLITGIVLNYFGLQGGAINSVLPILSDLGVMLLLFTIGLKLKVKQLFKPEVWVVASLHMILSVLAFSAVIVLLSFLSIHYFADLNFKSSLLIAFALSFSSTVFVIKILEDRGELSSFHGKIAIGILIIQDIFAVIFLTFTTQKTPSLFIVLLPLYLYVAKSILSYILDESGHGELLTVFGFFATFIAGAMVFYFLGLKPDLGALIIGMLLVDHAKSEELYDRMMNYKDFFLIAFFVSIGLKGIPDFQMVGIALFLLLLVLLKGGLFVFLFSFFNIKARTSFLSSISLTNYSEFGLITMYAGINSGLVGSEWLIILAIAMSFSFFLSSPLNTHVHSIFDNFRSIIMMLNRGKNCVDDEIKDLGEARYIVIGLGSLGMPAYRNMDSQYPGEVLGIDYNHDRVKQYQLEGINSQWADATNINFWQGVNFGKVKLVILAMSDFNSNFNTLVQINNLKSRTFKVAAISHYADEAAIFIENKVDFVYDYKSNVGDDFAEKALLSLN